MKAIVLMDINSTIVFGDLMSGKDPSFVLRSALFETATVGAVVGGRRRPPPPSSGDAAETLLNDYFDSLKLPGDRGRIKRTTGRSGAGVQHRAVSSGNHTGAGVGGEGGAGGRVVHDRANSTTGRGGEKVEEGNSRSNTGGGTQRRTSIKKMAKARFSRDGYRKFWRPENFGRLLDYLVEREADVRIYGKRVRDTSDFEAMCREYTNTLAQKTRNGVVRSWFELYRRHGGEVVSRQEDPLGSRLTKSHVVDLLKNPSATTPRSPTVDSSTGCALLMLHTFGVDSRLVLDETLGDGSASTKHSGPSCAALGGGARNGPEMFSIAFEAWSEGDKTSFAQQYEVEFTGLE